MNGKKARGLRIEAIDDQEYKAFKRYYTNVARIKSQNPKPIATRNKKPAYLGGTSAAPKAHLIYISPVAQLKKLVHNYGTAFIRGNLPPQIRWLVSTSNAFRHTGLERILQRLPRPLIEQTLTNALRAA